MQLLEAVIIIIVSAPLGIFTAWAVHRNDNKIQTNGSVNQ